MPIRPENVVRYPADWSVIQPARHVPGMPPALRPRPPRRDPPGDAQPATRRRWHPAALGGEVITILNRRHAALLFRHLRDQLGLSRAEVARRLFMSRKTLMNRETGVRTLISDEAIGHAHVLGFDLALIPKRHPGARPTGTGWPT
jgi:DNA-binding XRE family transcriptional regulator